MDSGPIILVVQGAGRDRLTKMLERNGFAVSRARNGKQAVTQAKESLPTLAVIDPSSLRINGTRLCQMLKRAVDSLPIIWMLDEGTEVAQDCGADSFLQRPCTADELLDQVQELCPQVVGDVLSAGDVVFQVTKRQVHKGRRNRRLTPKQAKLLEALMRKPGEVLSRRFLMKHVWNTDYLGDTRTLDVHVRWVREAIEEDPSHPKYLHTVRGVGYRFEAPSSETTQSED
jgi:DNA-binding response OmpR family regulator